MKIIPILIILIFVLFCGVSTLGYLLYKQANPTQEIDYSDKFNDKKKICLKSIECSSAYATAMRDHVLDESELEKLNLLMNKLNPISAKKDVFKNM